MLKIGIVAKKTGLTIRALRHYDEIGLLSPSHRTEAGYRLYTMEDLQRLQKIKSLQHLEFSLETVAGLLQQSDSLPSILMFTGGDPGIAQSLQNFYDAEFGGHNMASLGMNIGKTLFAYLQEAMAIARKS